MQQRFDTARGKAYANNMNERQRRISEKSIDVEVAIMRERATFAYEEVVRANRRFSAWLDKQQADVPRR